MSEAAAVLPRAAVLAVDGGNSKTEVVLLDRAGAVLGAARGPGSNHVHSDAQSAMGLIDSLVVRATAGSGESAEPLTTAVADVAVLCLAGADYPIDERRLVATAATFGWAERLRVTNDAFAMLRAGTDAEIGVALVCGAGVNCVGRGPAGRTVRFPALGDISGDWGGGYDIGMAALTAAVRAQDGRGPRTVLAELVPRHFGMTRPSTLVYALYSGQVDQDRVIDLPPIVFAAATDGDDVAGGIIDRQGDELVVMAGATLRRLRLLRQEVQVVLGGGILTSGNRRLLDRVSAGVGALAPQARLIELAAAPVAGAALLGLDECGLVPTADVRTEVGTALSAEESR